MVTFLSSPRRVPPRTVASLPSFRCAVTWDSTEHDVDVIVTEQGVADLRGKGPLRRAKEIIENCAHPDYRPMLREYLKFAEKGHEPQSMRAALAMHDTFLKKGDMRLTDFGEYLK